MPILADQVMVWTETQIVAVVMLAHVVGFVLGAVWMAVVGKRREREPGQDEDIPF